MTGSLLTEEINHKNNKGSCNGIALIIKGRSIERGKKEDRSRSKSKTHRSVKDIECYHCDKKRNLNKNYLLFKKKNDKEKYNGKKKAKDKFSVKIKEVSTLSGDSGSSEGGDILLTSSVEP